MNNKKCKHGYYTDPNGNHIYPEKSTAELIEEAKKLFEKKQPITVSKPTPLTERDKEIEKVRQQYNQYFHEKQQEGKISPHWFPKTFFDRDTKKNEEK